MAYEVIKTIGGREYRYSVQSERDTVTGKTRNRWTYLGRVAGAAAVTKARAARPNARLRLLEAIEVLLEGGEPAALTVDAIAAAAGVAHGTFYRYFRDRSDGLEALARHLRETRPAGDDRLLRDDVPSRAHARQAVRAWAADRLRKAVERRASIRTWYALMASDARLKAYREERRESTLRRLTEHLRALTARGFAAVDDPPASARALIALVEGVLHATVVEGEQLDAAGITAVAEIAERAIFGHVA